MLHKSEVIVNEFIAVYCSGSFIRVTYTLLSLLETTFRGDLSVESGSGFRAKEKPPTE